MKTMNTVESLLILLHVGYDDADEWKVIVSNDDDDTQLTIPFTVSYLLSSTRKG
jgi:hypothetical protein